MTSMWPRKTAESPDRDFVLGGTKADKARTAGTMAGATAATRTTAITTTEAGSMVERRGRLTGASTEGDRRSSDSGEEVGSYPPAVCDRLEIFFTPADPAPNVHVHG